MTIHEFNTQSPTGDELKMFFFEPTKAVRGMVLLLAVSLQWLPVVVLRGYDV